MKTYQEIKIVVTLFESDVVASSGTGQYEGVNELNPSTAPDWFDKK